MACDLLKVWVVGHCPLKDTRMGSCWVLVLLYKVSSCFDKKAKLISFVLFLVIMLVCSFSLPRGAMGLCL